MTKQEMTGTVLYSHCSVLLCFCAYLFFALSRSFFVYSVLPSELILLVFELRFLDVDLKLSDPVIFSLLPSRKEINSLAVGAHFGLMSKAI